MDSLAAVEMKPDARAMLVLDDLQIVDAFVEPQRGAIFTKMVAERVGDFSVDERQQPIALVDQGHPDAKGGKNAGVFAADHSGADHREGPGQPIEMENIVAGEDLLPVERNMRVAGGLGSSGDDDLAGLDYARGAAVHMVEANRIPPGKGSLRGEQLDIITHQLMASDVEFVIDYPVGPGQQILDCDVLLHRVGGAIKFSRAIAGQLENRLAQSLGRDCAEIDAASANNRFSLDDRDFLVELGALDGGTLTRRPRTDHQEIIIERVLGHALPFTCARLAPEESAERATPDDNLVTAR